jgi:hypothetical protein
MRKFRNIRAVPRDVYETKFAVEAGALPVWFNGGFEEDHEHVGINVLSTAAQQAGLAGWGRVRALRSAVGHPRNRMVVQIFTDAGKVSDYG